MGKQAYTLLSSYYDRLMDEDYEQWSRYLETLWRNQGVDPHRVLELGCGTGNLTIPLAERGYSMVAVDISAEMLVCAQAKVAEELDIKFIHEDLTNLALDEHFDLVFCACDAFNYLTSVDQFQLGLRRAYDHLKPGGVFLFDLNSELKLREVYGDESYADLYADFAYFWDNKFNENTQICEMELTFFIPDQNGRFMRKEELHQQKLWRPQVVLELLAETSWDLVGFYGFMTEKGPAADAQRWQFVCKKPSGDR